MDQAAYIKFLGNIVQHLNTVHTYAEPVELQVSETKAVRTTTCKGGLPTSGRTKVLSGMCLSSLIQ